MFHFFFITAKIWYKRRFNKKVAAFFCGGGGACAYINQKLCVQVVQANSEILLA